MGRVESKVSKPTLSGPSHVELQDVETGTEPFKIFSKMGKTMLNLPTGHWRIH